MKRQKGFLDKSEPVRQSPALTAGRFGEGGRGRKGMALILLYFAMVGFSIVLGSFIIRGIVESRMTGRKQDETQAYYLAEAGIDQVKRGLYDAFRANYVNIISADFAWFDDLPQASKYVLPSDAVLSVVPNGVYSVNITNVSSVGEDRDVTLECTAAVNNISKTITAVVRYGSRPAEVFDYTYFINNFGWLWGDTITGQGDIRSNGDFSFGTYTPTINGDVYASQNPDLGANGDIIGSNDNDSVNDYRSSADLTARPTNPTADGEGDYDYSYGYDGTSDKFTQQTATSMPYLGDLNYYETQAKSEGGTVTQCGVTLVGNVLGDDAGENQDIVLIGTDSCPIEINGPVVVRGDVVIKGKVKGQGTIFSGRNTHIVGNITYQNPPSWTKPDTDPGTTDTQNAAKDFLGLATKGNVVIGDYTSSDWSWIKDYIKPPFTQAYDTDSTDAVLGYDSDGDSGNGYRFDGDYTAVDGGTKADGSDRRFFESSYSDAYIASISDSYSDITHIDAVSYTNHAFTGRVGAMTINGSIVSRDEAIGYSGNITMNYDVRVQQRQTADDFYLPRQLDIPRTRFFQVSEN